MAQPKLSKAGKGAQPTFHASMRGGPLTEPMARTRKSPRSVLPGQRLRRRMASRAALVTNAELDGFVVKRVPTSEMLPAHYQNGHYSIYELERRRPCGAT